MGKTVFAEDSAYNYLKNLTKPNVCLTGLILGQTTDLKDFVTLLVRTPEQSDKETESPLASAVIFQSVKDIKESWIADHAKHITKMLPGGMWVLGVFICSPTDLFADNCAQSKAKSILYVMKKQLSNESLLYANSPSEKLLLHFNTVDFTYTCKLLDVNNIGSSFKSVDWKFQNNYSKWCQIYCNYDITQFSFGGNMSYPVKEQLKNTLQEVNENLDKAVVILNGQVKNPNETLENLIKKENIRNIDMQNDPTELPALKANILVSLERRISEECIVFKECDVELHLLGIVASQVFLSQNSTVAEAITAVKQDVVRSLAARFEMHWDSLVEEECGPPKEKMSVHEPPRRVSVLLPQTKIGFNDYLFPGEGACEVISSFKEMLDISITDVNLGKEIEVQGDPMEFYGKSSVSSLSTTSEELLRSPKGLLPLIFSIIIVVIAVSVALLIQKGVILKGNS